MSSADDEHSSRVPSAQRSDPDPEHESLKKGNRSAISDFYVAEDVADENEKFAFKVFIRVNARGIKFRNVSFQHCIFDECYFNSCVFDSCDFTGCRFLGSNFHQSSFAGCRFRYATFERTEIDDDVLTSEAPTEENLRMRFARSLRMNYQQIGDAKAANKAISLELKATSIYLRNSWGMRRSTYYKKKYPGWRSVEQFFRWLTYWILNVVWGNGESILKLMRTMVVFVLLITLYDTTTFENALSMGDYWRSFQNALAAFLGIFYPDDYPVVVKSAIAGIRFVAIALLAALFLRRLGHR